MTIQINHSSTRGNERKKKKSYIRKTRESHQFIKEVTSWDHNELNILSVFTINTTIYVDRNLY